MPTHEDRGLLECFTEFYTDRYRNEIRDLVQADPDDQHSLFVDWEALYDFDSDLADDYHNQPEQLHDVAEEVLRRNEADSGNLGRVHVRVHNLPEQIRISELRSQHLNSLVSIYGTVTRVSEVIFDGDWIPESNL